MAGRNRVGAAFGVFAFFALGSFGASADEKIAWYGDEWDEGAVLYYGIPESDYAPVSFFCPQKTREITFSFTSAPDNASEGAKVDVLLEAGGTELRILTTASWSDMDETFVLEGRTVLDDRLARLITADGTLVLSADGMKGDIPMAGAREAASVLLEACKG